MAAPRMCADESSRIAAKKAEGLTDLQELSS
jgi:hypothetical protein